MRFLTTRDTSESHPGVLHTGLAVFVRSLHQRNQCPEHRRHAAGMENQNQIRIAWGRVLAVALLLLIWNALTFAQTVSESFTNHAQLIPPISEGIYSEALVGMEHRSVSDKTTDSASSEFAPCHFPALANDADDRGSRQWQAEWAAGNQLAAKVEREETLIADPVITEYLNRLEQKIVRSSDLNGCFLVKLLYDAEVNAYALPGGFLYVTSGLILLADSEDQLTSALAHETGHVTARHFAKIQRQQRIGARLALASGPPGYLVRRLFGPLLTRKLIRNAEYEADRLSLKYQSASGHDPRQFSRLLNNARQAEGKPGSFVARLFDSHPPIKARIKRLDRIGNRLPQATMDYSVDKANFHRAKDRLSFLLKLGNPPSSLATTQYGTVAFPPSPW